MVDFARLNRESRERRENPVAAAAYERVKAIEQIQYVAGIRKVVAERIRLIERLVPMTPKMGDWDRKFVRSLQGVATAFDGFGILGGQLSTLSDTQLTQLGRIDRAYPAAAPSAPGDADLDQQQAETYRALIAARMELVRRLQAISPSMGPADKVVIDELTAMALAPHDGGRYRRQMLDDFPKSLEMLSTEGGQLGMLTMEQVEALRQLEASYFPAPAEASADAPAVG